MEERQPSLPPTTTHQEDRTLAGQRQVNLVWEVTQAIVALMVTGAIIYSAVAARPVADVLSNAFFLIIGFYYSRTNHQAIGGLGTKANESQPYRGR